jgi:hypothetical protein|tara:strand:+ start:2212 stop:3000 length:789 start_codon:yes stop_codon:yes gene_type:complete
MTRQQKQQEGFEIRADFLQPWSTFVMKTSLPPIILEKMIKITDEVIANAEGMKAEMSGTEQPKFGVTDHDASTTFLPAEIPMELEILEREDVMEFFLDVARQYVIQQTLQMQPMKEKEILNEEWYTKMVSMWLVSQRDNEFNPIHAHTGDNFHGVSTVMYLKIPEYLPNRNPTHNDDGAITFINNVAKGNWGTSSITIQPDVGDFYVFSSSQPHFVYPFRTVDGKGERRSVSFNTEFSSKSEQDFIKKYQKEKLLQLIKDDK